MEATKFSTIFVNADALSASYIPDEIIGRDEEIQRLRSILEPVKFGGLPDNVLIFGKPGVGKTATAKFTLNLISDHTLRVVYINCNQFRTESGVIRRICKEIDPSKRVPECGIKLEIYYKYLWEVLNEYGGTCIVVLDEIDRLKKQARSVLNMLSRANSEDRVINGKVGVVGISNDSRFFTEIEADTRSSLLPENVIFPAYDAGKLQQILYAREPLAFVDGALDESVIPLCSALAASEHGDARKALDLLYTAGTIAVEAESKKVNEGHVRKAYERYSGDTVRDLILALPLQQKMIVLGYIWGFYHSKGGKIRVRFSSGEIYSFYVKVCGMIGVEAITQKHISEYVDELGLIGILNVNLVSKGRYGRTKDISLNYDFEAILPVLIESLPYGNDRKDELKSRIMGAVSRAPFCF